LKYGYHHLIASDSKMVGDTGKGNVMPGSLRIGKVIGIDLYIHAGWFIILVLLTWSLASDRFVQLAPTWTSSTYWITALITSLLFFVSVLAHELAHAWLARAHNLTVERMTLFIFGGIEDIEQAPRSPGSELQIALIGPGVSLLLAGLSYALALPFAGTGTPEEAVLDYLAFINLSLGLINLLPGFPLDGGRVVRALLWKFTGNYRQAARAAMLAGQACAYLLIVVGIGGFFTGNLFNGLWTIFIGWFLLSAGQSAHTQELIQTVLREVTVRQAMNPEPVSVPANISIQKLIDEYFQPLNLSSAPVMQGGYLVGLITLAEIGHVQREHWGKTPVGYVMRLKEQLFIATPDQPLSTVLQPMITRGIDLVPVVQDDLLVGILSLESVLSYLQKRRSQPVVQ
jgi:Zn-dependent protease/CBS domain-containing protein